MNSGCSALSCLCLLLAAVQGGQSGTDPLKKKFLDEYPAAVNAWEARFARSEGTLTLTDDVPASKAAPHTQRVIAFKCKFPDMGVRTTIWTRGRGPGEGVSGFNRQYAFLLERPGAGADFSVRSLEAIEGAEDPRARRAARNTMTGFLRSPYSVFVYTKPMVSSDRFVLRAVSPVSRQGKSLLRVEFDWPNPPEVKVPKGRGDTGGYEGYFLTSPDERWVISEYESRQKKGDPGMS
jgi:hypothetical protein